MKALVTGANGFIGSHVVRKLVEAGREVRALVQRGEPTDNLKGLDIEIVTGDLMDQHHPKEHFSQVDTLYHLAAIYALWLPHSERMYQVNVEGTTRFLLQAMEKTALRKVVYTSSIAAVGLTGHTTPANEETQFNLWDIANDYILSKYISELEVQRLALQHKLPVTIVNPGFPIGTHDRRPTPTGQIIVDVLNGRYPGFIEGGFAAVDVEDVARGHLLAEEKGQIGQRYILTGHNVTYLEFGQTLGKVTGLHFPKRTLPTQLLKTAGLLATWISDNITHKHPPITQKAVAYSSKFVYFENRKAREELGLTITPLSLTLRKAAQWFCENGYIQRPLPAFRTSNAHSSAR